MERTTIFNRLSIAATTALAAVLVLGTVSDAPAQSMSREFQTCPDSVSKDIHGPEAIEYSWGVSVSKSIDSSQPSYTWQELARLGCVGGSRR